MRVNFPAAFSPGLVDGYWLSNIAGIVLLHKGIVCMVNPYLPMKVTRNELVKSGLWTLAYTGVLIILVKGGILKFLPDYFN